MNIEHITIYKGTDHSAFPEGCKPGFSISTAHAQGTAQQLF